jgi:tetratricopeptide (TPR) repeat protein
LEEIARELETAPPIPPVREEESVFETAESPSVEEFETPEIASETMAMILESQGKYEEARKVYEKLIETEPDKKEIFELKIKELSERNAENDG